MRYNAYGRAIFILPFVLLPVLWIGQHGTDVGGGGGGGGYEASQAEGKRVKELMEQLRFSRSEVERLRLAAEDARAKQMEAERNAARKLREAYTAPVPTPDPSDAGGKIFIQAAVLYCNCPVLVNGNNATAVLERQKAGAFVHSVPKKPSDPDGCIDLTEDVSASCNGKETCEYVVPRGSPVHACAAKFAADYSCDGKPTRSAVKYRTQKHQKVSIDCANPRSVPKTSFRNVDGVRPVKYMYNGMSFEVWPIGFTVPGHRFLGSIPWKDRDFASLIPANPATYKHTQQQGATGKAEPDTEYFHDYQHSYYCVTRKKKGWDCLRHYEILASGCVPYFIDLARMPASTMAFFPKELVWEAMNLPGVNFKNEKGSFWYRESFSIDHKVFNKSRYYELAVKIQAHARRFLTSEYMASYILRALEVSGGPVNPKRVLYIHHCYHDFMGDSLWNGFKEMELKGLLEKVHDVVPPSEMSVGGKDSMWGKYFYRGNCVNGRKVPLMTSAETLSRFHYYGWVNGWGNHRSHNYFPADTAVDQSTIPDRIRAREYDVIIYATPTRTAAWIDLVTEFYPPTSVAFLSGNDNPESSAVYAHFSEKGRMFVRELYDEGGGEVENPNVCFDAPGLHDAQGLDCCAMQDGGAKVVWSTDKSDIGKWSHCGKENEECVCSGKEIRFGDPVGARWSVIRVANKTKVKCHNLNSGGPFPDPALGSPKVCQCKIGEDKNK